MRRTLEMTVIEGIKTTVPVHLRILADADFVAGRLNTGFMTRLAPANREGTLAEAV
jgi:acetyl-CoA carboxylase biotin carboxylase subunit